MASTPVTKSLFSCLGELWELVLVALDQGVSFSAPVELVEKQPHGFLFFHIFVDQFVDNAQDIEKALHLLVEYLVEL